MYSVSDKFRPRVYSGGAKYKALLTIGSKTIEPRYIKSIKINDPVIDTSNKNMYIGSFVSKKVEIVFQNAMDIDFTQKVHLEIGLEIDGEFEYVPIGDFHIETSPEDYYKQAKITALDNAVLFKPNVDISEYFIIANLFDKENPNTYNYINLNISGSSRKYYCYIECSPNTKYNVFQLYSLNTNAYVGYANALPNENEDFVLTDTVTLTTEDGINRNATITTDENAKYLVVMYYQNAFAHPDYQPNITEDEVLESIEIYDASTENSDYTTVERLLKSLCQHFGVELGTYPETNKDVIIGNYDNTISGKQYISWLAEIMGSNAKIGRDGKLHLIPAKNLSEVKIDAKKGKSFTKGELYKVSRVAYDNGIVKHEFGENTNNTLTIRQDNLFVSGTDEKREQIVKNIYEAVKGLEIWNLTVENYGDISLDSTDIVIYTIGEEEYPTYYDNSITYEMTVMGKVSVSIPTKQVEETTNKIEADIPSQVRSLKTTVDQQNAQLTIVATSTQRLDTKVENNYQEITKKFDGYTPINDTVTIQNQVTQIINSTYTRTEIDTKMIDGTVEAVNTKTGMTFDQNGLTIDKSNSETKGNFNEKGLTVYKINKETGETVETVLEAVYDEKLGETKVNATNLTAYKFLMIDNVSRIQNYTDINGQNKTGIFWINYEEGEE